MFDWLSRVSTEMRKLLHLQQRGISCVRTSGDCPSALREERTSYVLHATSIAATAVARVAEPTAISDPTSLLSRATELSTASALATNAS